MTGAKKFTVLLAIALLIDVLLFSWWGYCGNAHPKQQVACFIGEVK